MKWATADLLVWNIYKLTGLSGSHRSSLPGKGLFSISNDLNISASTNYLPLNKVPPKNMYPPKFTIAGS